MHNYSQPMPLVSIIIPCFNSEHFINRAVESVVQQLYPNWELLLVDNNSTDHTLHCLHTIAAAHPGRVRVLQQSRKGACAARNMGAAHAAGSYLQFLDSDDELTPEKIAVQMDVMRTQNPGIVAGGITKVFTQSGQVTTSNHPCLRDDCWLALITTGLGRTSSLLFTQQAFLDAGGWNEQQTSSQEYELLFRMLARNIKLAYSDGFHTRIHLRPDSVHASADAGKKEKIHVNYITLRANIKKHLLANNQFDGAFARRYNYHMLGYLAHLKKEMPTLYADSLAALGVKPTPLYYIRKMAKRVKKSLTPRFF